MTFLKKLILISSIVLSGCAMDSQILLPEEKKVEIAQAILADCKPLVDTLQKGATFQDTLIAHAEDAKTYAECKELNNSKKRIIQEFLLNERSKQVDPEPEE